MNDTSSGWTFGKVLGLIVGLIGMVGFGLCSLLGISVGFSSNSSLGVWVLNFLGAVLTWLCVLLVRAMIRRAKVRAE